jgi:hypothetical protein
LSLQVLLLKYVQNSDKVLAEIKLKQDIVVLDEDKIREIIEYAKRYLSDAKYYGEKKQYETALAAVAYCEGILDGLRLLGMVEFTWPDTKEKQ